MAPPVVQPSLGLMALMQGVAALWMEEGERRKCYTKEVNKILEQGSGVLTFSHPYDPGCKKTVVRNPREGGGTRKSPEFTFLMSLKNILESEAKTKPSQTPTNVPRT